MCDSSPGSSPRPAHQDPLLPEGPAVRRGLQQLYPEVRVQHEQRVCLGTQGPFLKTFDLNVAFFIVSVVCSVLSVYEEHQKLLNELGGTKRGAENG